MSRTALVSSAARLPAMAGIPVFGAGGGGGKGGGHTPTEAPNTLQARNIVRILEVISEGEIEGPGVDGDWEKSTQLVNGTAIRARDGTYNFKGVQLEARTGLPDQSYLPGFPFIESTFSVGVEVKHGDPGPLVRRITSDVDAVRIGIGTPALSESSDDGDIVGSQFEIKIEVKSAADTLGSVYVTKVQDILRGKTTSGFQFGYRIALAGGPPYDIRVSRVSADETDVKKQNKCTWDFFTEITDRKLSYPDSAIVGTTINAQNFGNQIPPRGFVVKGIKVSVPSNYNPVTRVYTGEWDGTFTTAWSNNPAWVLNDIVTNSRYGCGDWFRDVSLDKWTLYQVAKYNDAWNARTADNSTLETDDYHATTGRHGVPDGRGGYEPRFTLNGTIKSKDQAYRVLEMIGGMMRLTMLWAGGEIGFIQDSPKSAARVFTPANVIGGQFNYTGTSGTARHTVATVAWSNPDKNYDQDTVVVSDKEGLRRYGYNQMDVTAVCCTSYGQAIRTGLYALYTERLETDTVAFNVGLADADILPGEIIKIADPLFTEAAHGGRLLGVSGTALTLDREFDFTTASGYTLTVVTRQGNLATRTITNPSMITDSIEIEGDWDADDAPLAGGMFVIESDEVEHRSFRVISVRENSSDGTAEVTALEYNGDKFALIDAGAITAVTKDDFSDLESPTEIAAPTTMQLDFSVKLITGAQHGQLRISWEDVDDQYLHHYRVSIQQGNENWVELPPTRTPYVDIIDPDLAVIRVLVSAVNMAGIFSPTLPGSINLANLTVLGEPCIYDLALVGGGTEWSGRDVRLTWKARSPYSDQDAPRLVSGLDPLFKSYRVEIRDKTEATLLGSFTTYTPDFTVPQEFLLQWGAARDYSISVYFVDRNDADSAAAKIAITNSAPDLPDVEATRNADTISLFFSQPDDADFAKYQVWMSDTSPVSIGAGTLVWDGAGAPTLPVDTNRTYYLRYAALDIWGMLGANVSDEITVEPNALSAVADFDAYPGEDRVRFVWTPVESNTPLDYEVREGATWATGRPFPRTQGNTLTVQRATSASGSSTYWIKAITRDGRAESVTARSVTNYQEPVARNVIFTQDESDLDWPGTKINLTQVGSGSGSYLQLDSAGGVRKATGDYLAGIDLGDLFYARNWAKTSFGRTTNSHTLWTDLPTTWAELGTTTWGPQAEPADGATLTVYIAPEEAPSDLIEGWRLAGNTDGVNGTTADLVLNLSDASCYNDMGQQMGDDSHLGWDVSGLTSPAMGTEFTFLVNVQPVDTTPAIASSMRIVEFQNGTDWLALDWYSADSSFHLIDSLGNDVQLVAPAWDPEDPITIGVAQGASSRSVFYWDLNNGVGGEASGAYALGFTPERVDLGGDFEGVAQWSDLTGRTWTSLSGDPWDVLLDVSKETEAVFGNAELRSTVYDYDGFCELARTRGPAGHAAYRKFLDGDYSYARAVVWARLAATPDTSGDISINELFTYADLPDLLDRGTATLSAAPLAVTFNRSFHATPEISITQVGGSGVVFPKITTRNASGFTVELFDVDGTTPKAGDVSWRAEGY